MKAAALHKGILVNAFHRNGHRQNHELSAAIKCALAYRRHVEGDRCGATPRHEGVTLCFDDGVAVFARVEYLVILIDTDALAREAQQEERKINSAIRKLTGASEERNAPEILGSAADDIAEQIAEFLK